MSRRCAKKSGWSMLQLWRAGQQGCIWLLLYLGLRKAMKYYALISPLLPVPTPVFIDSNRETWNMDPQILAEEFCVCAKKGKLPKAVIAVDLYGQCADYNPIIEARKRYEVPLIEDAAEALGATYNGTFTGKFGVMGVFSFNGNKIITTSGGGMLLSDNEDYVKRARFLSTQARDSCPALSTFSRRLQLSPEQYIGCYWPGTTGEA